MINIIRIKNCFLFNIFIKIAFWFMKIVTIITINNPYYY